MSNSPMHAGHVRVDPSIAHDPLTVQVATTVDLSLENHCPLLHMYDKGLDPYVVGTLPVDNGMAPNRIGGLPQSIA